MTAGGEGCLFLSLLSIAEEYTGRCLDFISCYTIATANGCMDKNFYMNDQERLLNLLTGKTWKKEVMTKLPDPVPEPMYTIERWYNDKTKFTHFKRRGFDTLINSNTVANGKLDCYYCYTVTG